MFGEKLKSTTLKMFGLTGGNALLRYMIHLFDNSDWTVAVWSIFPRRLIHRTEDQLRNQSVSSVYKLPAKPKPIEEPKPTRNVNKKDDTRVKRAAVEVDASTSSMQVDVEPPVTVQNSIEDTPASVNIVNPIPNDEDMKTITENMEEVVSCSGQPKTEPVNARKPPLNINEIDYVK